MKQDQKGPEFAGPNEKANFGEDRRLSFSVFDVKVCPTCGSPEPGVRLDDPREIARGSHPPCLDPFHGPFYVPDRRPTDPQRGTTENVNVAEMLQSAAFRQGIAELISTAAVTYAQALRADSARLDKLEQYEIQVAKFKLPNTAQPGFLLTASHGILLIESISGKAKPTLREAIDDAEELG